MSLGSALSRLTTPDPDGDTIIEVMVVLAVLGLAIGICYATANRSLLNTRQAQENTIAATYVQSQIEALRTMTANPAGSDDIFTQTSPFCINTTTTPYKVISASTTPAYPSGCNLDTPPYTLGINYNAKSPDPGTFTVTAHWPDVLGQGTDTVTEYYRLHGAAVATVTPPPPPPPSGGTCPSDPHFWSNYPNGGIFPGPLSDPSTISAMPGAPSQVVKISQSSLGTPHTLYKVNDILCTNPNPLNNFCLVQAQASVPYLPGTGTLTNHLCADGSGAPAYGTVAIPYGVAIGTQYTVSGIITSPSTNPNSPNSPAYFQADGTPGYFVPLIIEIVP